VDAVNQVDEYDQNNYSEEHKGRKYLDWDLRHYICEHDEEDHAKEVEQLHCPHVNVQTK
jgi:hypothetical protein